jgi:hypothetical protein
MQANNHFRSDNKTFRITEQIRSVRQSSLIELSGTLKTIAPADYKTHASRLVLGLRKNII